MSTTEQMQQLADKIAIRELLDEYCLRLEVNPFEEWLDLFTDDTVYEVYGKTLEGRQALSDMLSKAPHGVHLGGPMRIAIDGDRADTVQNYAFFGDNDKYTNKGWYYRTLKRTEQGWRISYTRVEFQKSAG